MIPVNLGNRFVNNYLYPIKEGYVLIDTGYENDYKRFSKELAANDLHLEDITYIFLTHSHDDHVGFLNLLLKQNPSLKVILSEAALTNLFKGQNSFDGGCTSPLALSFCHLMNLFGKGEHRFPPLEHAFKNRCLTIDAQNKASIENVLCGKIYETPGHTNCSISLMLNSGELFCGDAAMNGFPSQHKISIWAEYKDDYIRSWHKMIHLSPKIIYPGHGKPFDYHALSKNLPFAEQLKIYPLKQK